MSDETNTTQEGKREPLQSGAIAGVIVFLVFGFLLAQPCLCREGAVVGFYKSIFYFIVVVRLLFGILMRNLKKPDFLLWVGGFVLFCIVAECLY